MKTTDGTKRVLLQDIASETGYTVNTVSRALQNKPDISKATAAHIQQVAAQMGYVRNNIASSLRSGRSRTIAVIVGGASNPFYAIMIDSIHNLAEEIGYTMLVLCTRDLVEQERKAILTSISRQVDGILLYPSNQPEVNIALLQQSGIPFVLVSRHTEHAEYDYVVSDEETGGYLAGKHLIEAGHRKLAFVYSYEVIYSSIQRVNGFLRAAHEAGIPESDIRMFQYQSEPQCADQLIRWREEGVSGLFLFCDIEAWQLMGLMEKLGLRENFSLVGFDNIQGIIGFPSPLCTIDSSIQDVSKAAFDILIRRINGDRSPVLEKVFPVRLVCRGSCKPICPEGCPID